VTYRARGALSTVLSLVLFTTSARAQTADHLKCYKINDPQAKATYTADLGGLVPESGCTIKVPAKLLCVHATKTNVSPPPIVAPPADQPGDFLCYAIKCPKAGPFLVPFSDQFGARTVEARSAKVLCVPRIVGFPTTTVTTTTTTIITATTTSTTLPMIIGYMDPCSLRCDFVLCATQAAGGAQLGHCTNSCDVDGYRISTPVQSKSVFEVVESGSGGDGAKALIDCEFVGRPCLPCQSDADCDDGNAATRDVCVPIGANQASCRHLCPQ